MFEEDKKLLPGDEGYKGGIFHSTIYINGKAKEVRTEKDSDGNIVSVSITNKIWGLFWWYI